MNSAPSGAVSLAATPNQSSLWPALSMLVASFAFAGMAACIKLATNYGVPMGQIVFYRGLVSVLLMGAVLRLRSIPMRTPHFKAHMWRGFAGFAGMVAYIAAIELLPLATAVTLNYTSPLILASMLLVIHRERPPPVLAASILGGLGGIVMLTRPNFDQAQWLGGLTAMASALLAAISAINIRTLGRLDEPAPRTVLYFSLFITLGSVPMFLASLHWSMDLRAASYIAASASLATLGQVLLTLAYQRGQTMLISLLGYSQIIFSTLLAMVLWGDRLPLISWIGIALIVSSGAFAMSSARKPVPHSEPSVT